MTAALSDPLTTDRAVLDLLQEAVGEAIRPQVWVLLLDADDRALPVVLPIDDVPIGTGAGDADRFAGALDGIAAGAGAAAVLLAWERPGPDDLTPTEAAWVADLRRSFDGRATRLRALVLVHDRGRRLLGPADAVVGRVVATAEPGG
jgi:hypothetical protein